MKKLLMPAVAAAGLLLASCTTVTLAQIQAATIAACGFLPTAVQLAELIPTPYTTPAADVATIICAAVTAKTAGSRHRLGASAPITVSVTLPNGTVAQVTGYFVTPAARHR